MKALLQDLKHRIKVISVGSKFLREAERKQTRWARFLGKRHAPGYFRHGPDTPRPEERTDWRFYETVGEGEDKQRVLSNTQPTDDERRAMEQAVYERLWNLHHKRTVLNRKQARNLNLAYGCLRGKPYEEIEAIAYEAPDFEGIEKIVREHSTGSKFAITKMWSEWFDHALWYWWDQEQARQQDNKTPSQANPVTA